MKPEDWGVLALGCLKPEGDSFKRHCGFAQAGESEQHLSQGLIVIGRRIPEGVALKNCAAKQGVET